MNVFREAKESDPGEKKHPEASQSPKTAHLMMASRLLAETPHWASWETPDKMSAPVL